MLAHQIISGYAVANKSEHALNSAMHGAFINMMKSTKDSFHLAQLFDFVEDALAWVKDRQGRYLWVNRAFLIKYALEHSGVDGLVEEILGKTDYDLSPAFMADQFRLDDEQVLSGHRIINRIERVGEFEGMTAWNITNKIPVFDAKGAIIGTAGITRRLSTGGLPGPVGTVSGFEPALAYMRDHYHRAITNQQLASISKMSLRAFERQFLASFHLTPQKYLRKLRLRIASRALIYTNEALSEVALSCGFADQSHFTREFRRQFGRTPREYREHYKLSAGAPVTKTADPSP